jgi:hypothetical protein
MRSAAMEHCLALVSSIKSTSNANLQLGLVCYHIEDQLFVANLIFISMACMPSIVHSGLTQLGQHRSICSGHEYRVSPFSVESNYIADS